MLDIGCLAEALAFFLDPAAGRHTLACGTAKLDLYAASWRRRACLRPGRGRRDAAVLGGIDPVLALTVFEDRRRAASPRERIRTVPCASGTAAGGAALLARGTHDKVNALAAFVDPAARRGRGSELRVGRQDFAGVGRRKGGTALHVVVLKSCVGLVGQERHECDLCCHGSRWRRSRSGEGGRWTPLSSPAKRPRRRGPAVAEMRGGRPG